MSFIRFLIISSVFSLSACQSFSPKNTANTLTTNNNTQWLVAESDLHCFPIDGTALVDDEQTLPEGPIGPNDSLWPRLQAGLTLPYEDNAEVRAQLNWYVKHPEYIERIQLRASRYLFAIIERLHQYDIPFDIALLPIVESAFEPFAYSHGQASGLWQFIPSTGKRFQLDQNWWFDGRRDVVASTDAAMRYLQYLHRFFDGNWQHALAAYNSGEGTVRRAIQKNQRENKPTDFWHLTLPAETRGYVPKMIALVEIFRHPEKYNITLLDIPNSAYFTEVNLDSQLDLMQAADLAKLSIDELYYLNAGLNRWATPPGNSYQLKIPVEAEADFRHALSQLPSKQRITWQRHIVSSGESLNSIAKKYHSDIEWIKEINQLSSSVIYAGHALMIPVASANLKDYRFSENNRLDRKQNSAPNKNLQKNTYIVQAGDTFWSISRLHKVQVAELARWNNKSPRDTLRVGEKLVIWQSAGMPNRQARIARVNYRVRNGDSLAKIASKFSVQVQQIVQWNQLDSKKYLQPGQTLTLHVNVMNTSQ